MRNSTAMMILSATILVVGAACANSAATREARRRDTTRAENDRPLEVASRSDRGATKNRPTTRTVTKRPNRAHIEPTPVGYGAQPATKRSTRPARQPLRRIDPPQHDRSPRQSPPEQPASRPPSDRPSDSYVARPADPLPPEAGMRVYHVKPGDTLWSLARTYYGDSKHWRRILAANRNRVPDPRDLPVGIILIIP
ncbi:MAG TPA: LysM peptidoglycan-binding domain-containing protein [Phycisphaerae bacterium]|nr:LysM peptidoglycan-binding domain-containing protein [Phycisphaerae bacterium]HRW51254.1 LysM peptidoglycan-binding domain-containing protein [Phycisphaerae bacterium]